MCLDADISFAPVARPQDLFDNPHLLANGSLAPTTLPGGVKTRLPLLPFQMFGWRPPLVSDPPEVGQHNDEVLAEIGYDTAGIDALKAAGHARAASRGRGARRWQGRTHRSRGRCLRMVGRQPARLASSSSASASPGSGVIGLMLWFICVRIESGEGCRA